MGLIKTAIDSIKGTLRDQHLTAINCENMDNSILLMKKTKENGIIRNGSIIIVNPGQMAVVIDNGKVIDASAEPGAFKWDSDASASFFAGNFGGVFGEMWKRFAFGGGTYQDQAIYYINAKEIMDNGFGTPAPVMYSDWQHPTFNKRTGQYLPMQIKMKCAGSYTFMIDQPWEFLKRVGGTANMYQKDDLTDQMRLEILDVFQSMLNSLSKEPHRVPPAELPSQTSLIKKLMEENEFDAVIRKRGVRIEGIQILTMQLDAESEEKIRVYEATSDDMLFMDRQQERMADTMKTVGSNEAGIGAGFLGIGMMNNIMGGPAGTGLVQQPGQQPMMQQPMQQPMMQQQMQQPMMQQPMQQPQPEATQGGVSCANCGAAVAGPFCSQCGTPALKPEQPAETFCSQCGALTKGPFCTKCGTRQ